VGPGYGFLVDFFAGTRNMAVKVVDIFPVRHGTDAGPVIKDGVKEGIPCVAQG
jgi:hypothetical protein